MPKIMGGSLAEHRERTRTALFDALSRLMAARSFDKITLSDVAAHAGVGRTAVYNHFADKEDLLLAFMEHETARYAEELSAALAGVEDPIDRLRAHAGLMAQMLAQILNDAVADGAIPPQDPAQVIPLVHACVMGGRPTPTDPVARTAYLDALDTFVLRAVGAPAPAHGVPMVPPTHATQEAGDETRAGIAGPAVRAVAG